MFRFQLGDLRGTAARGLAAMVAVSLAAGLLYLLRAQLSTPIVALLFLLPVVLSTTVWGLGAGILAAAIAFLLFNFLFITPYYTFQVHQTQDLLALVVFLGVAILISQLVGRAQAGLAAAQAREREATQLYELSRALSGLRDEDAIARTTAERVRATTGAQAVELVIEASAPNTPWSVRIPGEAGLPAVRPLVFPLTTTRGQSGELRLWPRQLAADSVQQRLIQTMVSQAALALEHVRLTQAETQARILMESDRLKSALLSSVSHDLRTPLVSITGALSSLQEDGAVLDEGARRTLVDNARGEAERLNRLVGNLLDMTRLESGAVQIKREPVDVEDLVGTALQQLGSSLRERAVTVNIPAGLPLIHVGFVLMLQVLTNLLDNAHKYSPLAEPIEVTARRSDGSVEIEIDDRGIGIPPEDLPRVFDKFYRVQRPARVMGTGLGLSIAKGIVEAHGGRIRAENRPGGGTRFCLALPVAPVRDDEAQQADPHER